MMALHSGLNGSTFLNPLCKNNGTPIKKSDEPFQKAHKIFNKTLLYILPLPSIHDFFDFH